jgi:hypothetical protein
MLEEKIEQKKSFTEKIKENVRKNVPYMALFALSLYGRCGVAQSYTPQNTYEYTRKVPTEYFMEGKQVYREEKVRIDNSRTRLVEVLRGDCDKVSGAGDLITCEDYVCVERTPRRCSTGKYGDGSCTGGECTLMGYGDRWELPIRDISSVFAEVDDNGGKITIRKKDTGWSAPEEKVLSFKNADVCKEVADILHTFFVN